MASPFSRQDTGSANEAWELNNLRKKNGDGGVLDKVFKILDVLRGHPVGATLKTVSEAAQLNKATAYRLLTQLQRAAYVFRDSSRLYTPGHALTQFSQAANVRTKLREAARPALKDVWKATQETVNLGVLDEGTVFYVDVIESPHVFRLASRAGMRRPVYSTALGKALVAFMPADQQEELLRSLTFSHFTVQTIMNLVSFRRQLKIVRNRGYAVDQQESVTGARCVAAPVLDLEGFAVAAVSIAGPVARISQNKIRLFGAAAIDAARQISAWLYGDRPSAVDAAQAPGIQVKACQG